MSKTTLGLLLGFIGVVCFGGTLPMTKLAVREVDPWFVTYSRAALAAFLGMATLIIMKKSPPPKSEWADYCIASVMITFGFPGLVALGMKEVPSNHGGVILGIMPLATAIISTYVNKERLSKTFWGLSILGACLVIIYALRQNPNFTFHKGDLILFGAVLAGATAYAYSGKLSKTRQGWEVVSWALLPVFPLTFALFLYYLPSNVMQLSASTYWGLAYVVLISQFFGFFPWNAGLAMGGVARVGQMLLVMPFITLIFSSLFLGETITVEMMVFLAAVVAVVIAASKFR